MVAVLVAGWCGGVGVDGGGAGDGVVCWCWCGWWRCWWRGGVVVLVWMVAVLVTGLCAGVGPDADPARCLQGELLSPCRCCGSVRCTHHPCLIKWISERGSWACELCYYKYQVIAISTKNPLQVSPEHRGALVYRETI